MIDYALVIGIIGSILILIGFIIDEFTKIGKDTLSYNLINFTGASILSYYAFIVVSWPFLILNVIWTIVAIVKIVQILRKY